MYLLLGYGISNQSIAKYFNKLNIKYDVINYTKYVRFSNFDILKYKRVIKSPIINDNDYYIKIAKKNKIEILTDLDLFYILKPNLKSIAITGTNGKSTTAEILYKFIPNSILCGNIGIPIFDHIDDNGLFIIEVSSFTGKFIKYYKPTMSIITNITQDHLDYHKSFNNYIKDKLNIFRNCKNNHYLVTNIKNRKILENYDFNKIYINNSYRCTLDIDRHNYFNKENIILAYIVSNFFYRNDQYKQHIVDNYNTQLYNLTTYKVNDKIIINNSKSTNQSSLLASIKTIDNYKQTTLIICGVNKFENLYWLNRFNFYKIYFISNSNNISLINSTNYTYIKSTKENYINTIKEVLNSDCKYILFSPGHKSFDIFHNYKDRGKFFDNIIKNTYKL